MIKIAVAASAFLLAMPAHADPDITASVTRAPAMRLDVGLFSPVGSIGLVYTRSMHEIAAVELGGGIGFSGLQLSAMGKLRLGPERTRFTPGLGVSVGLPVLGSAVHEGHPPGEDEMNGPAVTMVWLDVDLLGIEHRTENGFVLSAAGGVTLALTEGHWDSLDLGADIERFDGLPQFRLGVGKTF